jgi:programmed cell death protein 5
MAMQGKLPGKINEGQLIEMLERGVRGAGQNDKGQKISIQRKKYAFDSDDEDDDEDLL